MFGEDYLTQSFPSKPLFYTVSQFSGICSCTFKYFYFYSSSRICTILWSLSAYNFQFQVATIFLSLAACCVQRLILIPGATIFLSFSACCVQLPMSSSRVALFSDLCLLVVFSFSFLVPGLHYFLVSVCMLCSAPNFQLKGGTIFSDLCLQGVFSS